MRIAICDDEHKMLEIVDSKITDYSNSHNWDAAVYKFDNGNELIKCDIIFDIIILDYQMEQIDGLETARQIRTGKNGQACLIFLTSYPEIAIPAYDVDTYRFVLKNNLDNGLNKALDDFRSIKSFEVSLCIKVNKDYISINSKDILFIEVVDKFSYIHMITGKVYDTRTSLSSLYGKLPKTHFYKVHKAYVVNFAHIIRRSENDVFIKGYNSPIPISRNYLSIFKRKYYNFLNDFSRW